MKFLLKIILTLGILYWLVIQNKLDFSLVPKIFDHPINFISALFLAFFQIILCAWRWKLLMAKKFENVSYSTILGIQWIGQFFSLVLPGKTSGDLVKIRYVSKSNQDMNWRTLLFIILIDRIIGMTALFFIAGIACLSLVGRSQFVENDLYKIVYVNAVLFITSLGFLIIASLKKNWQQKILFIFPYHLLGKFFNALWSLNEKKNIIQQAFIVSLFSQVLTIVIFWTINTPFFEKYISISELMILIPIGQLVAALPITPAGLGTGHIAYANIFQYSGHSNGASLYNIYWVVISLSNLGGIVPYFFLKPCSKIK